MPGIAVTVALFPNQTGRVFTVTVGKGFIVTAPEALELKQVVNGFVITTL